jgi:hypothetical protein
MSVTRALFLRHRWNFYAVSILGQNGVLPHQEILYELR